MKIPSIGKHRSRLQQIDHFRQRFAHKCPLLPPWMRQGQHWVHDLQSVCAQQQVEVDRARPPVYGAHPAKGGFDALQTMKQLMRAEIRGDDPYGVEKRPLTFWAANRCSFVQ